MQAKRQFRTQSKKRAFFDRQLIVSGGTRYLAVGKIVPKEWLHVRLETLQQDDTTLILRITKLYGEEQNTPAKTTDKGSKQDT